MAFFKSFLKFSLRLILVIVSVLVLASAGLLIYYGLTIRSAEEYLPESFLFYLKIDSLKDIYNNVLDLKAADVIFSQDEFKSIYNALLEYKSNDFARNEFLKMILEMKTSIVVHPDRSLTLVLEPGLLSLVTRNFGLVNELVKIENVSLTSVQKGKITLYRVTFNGRDEYYFSVTDNLVFFSTKETNIEALYENKETGHNLYGNRGLARVREKLPQKGMLDLYVSTPMLIDMLFKDAPDVRDVFSKISFNDLSLLSLTVSNDKLDLGIYTSLTTDNETVRSFLSYNPGTVRSIQYFPLSTRVFTAVNIKSFKDLYALLLVVQGKGLSETVSQIDGLSKSLLGISIDDLLFSWTGEEVGAFLPGDSADPVIYVRIRDNEKLNKSLDRLAESLFLDRDSSLIFNNVRLSRITFPPLVKGIVDLFIKNFEMPYFHVSGDFIFFCMNPETLVNAVNDYKAERVLLRDANFKTTTENLPKDANLFLYYDLTRSLPPFFPPASLPSRLFRLYESGAISVYFRENELKVFATARGIAGRKTLPSPGFPKQIEDGIKSPVLLADLSGSAVGELVYSNASDQLVIRDLVAGTSFSAPLEPQSFLLIGGEKATGNAAVFTYSPSGTLGKYGPDAVSIPPFPMITVFKNSFPPVDTGENLLLYSRQDAAFFLFPKAGGKEARINFTVENPVLAPPDVKDGLIAFYPKTFEGTVYVIDFQGNLKKGWPEKGGGISFCSPLFVSGPGGNRRVVFLTQAGTVNLWDQEGQAVKGFPTRIEGIYFCNPVLVSVGRGNPQALAFLNEQGLCTLITQEGVILKQKPIEGAGDRKSELVTFDIDRDGTDELFIYGAKNFIIGLDRNLELLPGFPVKGGGKPIFADVNLDGKPEMLSAGFDNQLYAYELNK